MGYRDWQGVCKEMKTGTGLFWPIPITLSVSEEAANNIKIGDEVALTDNLGHVYGRVTTQEIYQIDKAIECNAVRDSRHKPSGRGQSRTAPQFEWSRKSF